MINAYTQAITSAREVDANNRNRLRGWLVVKGENSEAALVSLAYIEEGVVAAASVWAGTDSHGLISMLADHLNENAGAGPELVAALSSLYKKSAKGEGLLAEEVAKQPVILH